MAIRELSLGGMNWRKVGLLLDWVVPLGFGVFLCLAAPLRTALEFGADEGFELMKALLVSQGHPLYQEIWNDQPPLHTEVLALLFRVFGPSAYVGRLLSVAFAMVLVGSLYQIVRHQAGRVGGLVAVLLLVSSSSFLQLSVSVMLELPAMALGMASLWAWSNYAAAKGKPWLILSGALFACALQVKLTAGIVLPALLMVWLVFKRPGNKIATFAEPMFWPRRLETLIGIGSVLLTFGIILSSFYRPGTVYAFWGSHFSEGTQEVASQREHAFRPETLLKDPALAISAAAGLALAAFLRRRDFLGPVVLLMTAFAVHSWHRPYWHYYGLHFAIPMAWLGAVGITEWFRVVWRQESVASASAKFRLGAGVFGWSAVVSLVLSSTPERFWWELAKVRVVRTASESEIVTLLKNHAAATRWVFTDHRIEAFWARLPIPPELAVIPAKRIWSGQITSEQVLSSLKRHLPELILIPLDWERPFGLSNYLREHYEQGPDSIGSIGDRLYLPKR